MQSTSPALAFITILQPTYNYLSSTIASDSAGSSGPDAADDDEEDWAALLLLELALAFLLAPPSLVSDEALADLLRGPLAVPAPPLLLLLEEEDEPAAALDDDDAEEDPLTLVAAPSICAAMSA